MLPASARTPLVTYSLVGHGSPFPHKALLNLHEKKKTLGRRFSEELSGKLPEPTLTGSDQDAGGRGGGHHLGSQLFPHQEP